MKSFFRNPLGHIITGLFCLIVGWMFLHQLDYFVTTIQKLPLHLRDQYDFTNQVIIKLFNNINFLFLFITPVLSMKIFSEEFRERTIELYQSSPVTDYEIVLGKYFALLSQGLYLILMTSVYPFMLGNIDVSDLSFLLTGYLGLILNLSSFLALGLLSSSLSGNQVISALAGFVSILLIWIVGWFGQLAGDYFSSKILNFLSVNFHFTHFLKGMFSLSDISFYVCFISFILFLTKKRLEIRLW